MSARVKYDPANFHIQVAGGPTTRLGAYVIGVGALGTDIAWTDVRATLNSFSLTIGYDEEDVADNAGVVHRVLMYTPPTASLSMSWWDNAPAALLPPDHVRVTYSGTGFAWEGVVESATLTYTADPQAARYGAAKRVDLAANLIDYVGGALLSEDVSFPALPAESPLARIERWFGVTGP